MRCGKEYDVFKSVLYPGTFHSIGWCCEQCDDVLSMSVKSCASERVDVGGWLEVQFVR